MRVGFKDFCVVALAGLEEEDDFVCVSSEEWPDEVVKIVADAKQSYEKSASSDHGAIQQLFTKLFESLKNGPGAQHLLSILEWLESEFSIVVDKKPPSAENLISRRDKVKAILNGERLDMALFKSVAFPRHFVSMLNPEAAGILDESLIEVCLKQKVSLFTVEGERLSVQAAANTEQEYLKRARERVLRFVNQKTTSLSLDKVAIYTEAILRILMVYEKNPCLHAFQLVLAALKRCNVSVLKIRDLKEGEGLFSINVWHNIEINKVYLDVRHEIGLLEVLTLKHGMLRNDSPEVAPNKANKDVASCYISCSVDLDNMRVSHPRCFINTNHRLLHEVLTRVAPTWEIKAPMLKDALRIKADAMDTAKMIAFRALVLLGTNLWAELIDSMLVPSYLLSKKVRFEEAAIENDGDYARALSVDSKPLFPKDVDKCSSDDVAVAVRRIYPQWADWQQGCLDMFIPTGRLNIIEQVWTRLNMVFIKEFQLDLSLTKSDTKWYQLNLFKGAYTLVGCFDIIKINDRRDPFGVPIQSCTPDDPRMLTYTMAIRFPLDPSSPFSYEEPTLQIHPGCGEFKARVLEALRVLSSMSPIMIGQPFNNSGYFKKR